MFLNKLSEWMIQWLPHKESHFVDWYYSKSYDVQLSIVYVYLIFIIFYVTIREFASKFIPLMKEVLEIKHN